MNKVILTKEQAKAMEELKSEHLTGEVVKTHLNDRWSLGLESLNDLTVDEFAQAYYSEDGYEVEPEFKVGDWVYSHEFGVVKKILEIRQPEGQATYYRLEGQYSVYTIRHATPSEIAKEKERRFFAKNGRKPWELREDDILEYLGDLLIVDSFDSEDVCFRRSKGSIDDYFENLDYVKEHFKVVCFADKRLDVKTND